MECRREDTSLPLSLAASAFSRRCTWIFTDIFSWQHVYILQSLVTINFFPVCYMIKYPCLSAKIRG